MLHLTPESLLIWTSCPFRRTIDHGSRPSEPPSCIHISSSALALVHLSAALHFTKIIFTAEQRVFNNAQAETNREMVLLGTFGEHAGGGGDAVEILLKVCNLRLLGWIIPLECPPWQVHKCAAIDVFVRKSVRHIVVTFDPAVLTNFDPKHTEGAVRNPMPAAKCSRTS